jgi:hypothetical protein
VHPPVANGQDLATRINALHAASLRHARTSIEHAYQCGLLLLQAKEHCLRSHQPWLAWLTAHCHFTRRTATNYMGLASNRDRLGRQWETIAHDGVAGVLKAIAADKKATQRHQRQRAARRLARQDQPGDDLGILTGDLGLLHEWLADSSVDLLLTDPPYDPASLPLYDRIAALAAVKLKPGGLCLTYAGKLYLPQVLDALGRHLTYWWEFAIPFAGSGRLFFARRVREGWRPVLAFCRPPLRPAPDCVLDWVEGGGREKDLHDWQQAESEASYLIEHLTEPGDMVVDPCCGSGTVPAAAQATGRRWLATEIDPVTAATARERLRQEQTR